MAAGRGGRGRPERRPGDADPVADPVDDVGAAGPDTTGPAADDPAPAALAPDAAVVDATESFRPSGQQDLAPAGEMAKLRANLAALRTLREVQAAGRPATAQEQAVLARWSGWGAVAGVFEARTNHPNYARFAEQRAELRELLSPAEFAAAERTVLNAHYTDVAYVQGIWDAVRELGFDGGTVLEPGCGSGNFIGLAPTSARMVGVELDPVTAGIAAALYPHAEIRTESFAETRAPSGAFDLAVGNVPFARLPLVDRRHNPGRHSLHNHFIIKSLHLTRPGGLVAVLTSRFTMDARHPAARREMAALADLVAAVRLPSGAHQATAGTQAITDLLILRRREPDREPAAMTWEQTRPLDLDTDAEQPEHVNGYFLDRPERVLGEMVLGRGMNRDGELIVRAGGDTAEDLARVLRDVVAEARRDGLAMTPRDDADRPAEPLAVLAPTDRAEGHIEALDDGTFTTVADGQVVPHEVPATQAAELRALLGLRDTVTALLSAEAATLDDGDEHGGPAAEGTPAALRAQLNDRYDAYVAAYGPLNRYTRRPTGRTDPETGEPKMARINPPMGKFRQTDPHAATVFALEHFDEATQRATKADIFARRVILPRAPQLGADTPQDALAICVDTHGEVRLPEVARLLGVSEPEARAALGELVYDEPDTGRLVEAPEYLSGNVRVKLRAAQAAAEEDPRFEANVRALHRVVPRDLGPGEIDAAFGAPFLPAAVVEQFLRETLRDPGLRVEHVGGSDWRVRGSRAGVLARSTWGTAGMAAPDLAQRLLTKTPIRVFVEVEEGKRALDVEATAAAQAKAIELEERFGAWVWEDPDRAAEVATTYNEMFNATVPRSYVGVTRSLPGIAVGFVPRPHQVEAVARIVAEPAVGLFHAVGAGKTAVMAISAMEQRRLGLVNKPAIVVPNHMLEQFTREFLQIYPRARLLAAGRDDMSTQRRRRFVARCATGDWDAIIMAASFFERLSLSPDEQRAFLDEELAELREKIVRAGEQAIANGESPKRNSTVKRLQNTLARKEERIKEKLDRARDPGVTFEQTGIDFIYRDELHELKNDTITSAIPDAGHDGSDRAVDFRMKLSYLRRKQGLRVVCGATATPIANSVRELYVVTRQLRPDLLAATGTTDFDTWAATFAKVVTAIEVSPTGQGFQMRARLAKYTNVPELSLMMRTYGDVRTPEDLALPTPLLTQRDDGERAPHIVTLDPSPELEEFISSLDERVDDIRNRRVEPEQDNMLKVSGEARAASLDMRLIDGEQNSPGKIDAAADRIAAIWRDTRDTVYLLNPDAATPVPHPTPGALQIVFCDQSTPNPEKWNVYDALADLLVERGMPREKIRYIHEADTDAKKASLFNACRSGDVAVLIGSTAKMGVGTNVQARAVALHHLDCPWRPADVTQREGRILRQGNQNAEVSIYRYVVAGSFDAFSWQTVARKGTFIDQLMRGTSAREIEDVSDETLQAHQIKAIATGNPLLMDREQVAQDLTRLDRADRAHHNTQAALRRQIGDLKAWITKDTRRVDILDDAISRRQDTRGDKFTATVAGHRFTKRAEAGRALQHALTAHAQGLASTDQREADGVAELGGFRVDAVFWTGRDGMLVALKFHGIPDSSTTISLTAAVEGDPTGLVRRLENQLTDLDSTRATVQARIAQQQEEIDRATEQLDQPFPRRAELLDTRRRLRAINAVIDLMAAPPPPTPTAPPAVPVIVTDWMPTDLREGLTPDEQSWLDRRVQIVAGDRAVQQAARTTDLPTFAATFDTALSHALADPGNTEMAVAVMLKCDDPAWRRALYTAAGQAVHQAVRDAPPPPSPSAAPTVTPTAAAEQHQPADPLTPAEIVAATTPEDRALLDACSKQAFRVDDVQAAIHAHDQVAFATAYASAMTTAISEVDNPDAVVRLAELHGDEAFRTGLTNLVWEKLTPPLRAERQAVPTATVDSASVAAKAFLPAPRAASTNVSAAAPISPAPVTAHRGADHDHAR
ncbi:helicase-related protein [Micromonospora sp. NPDC048063]|uniref:helicase-related protein n=1 Tax=Micromonospora sp. NPDC048063 TaxID=3364256 RepID=UPI0037222AC2